LSPLGKTAETRRWQLGGIRETKVFDFHGRSVHQTTFIDLRNAKSIGKEPHEFPRT